MKELYLHNILSMHYFHKKYMLSPAQLGRTIRKFLSVNQVSILDGNKLKLTERGRQWIVLNRKEIFLKPRSKYWRDIPTQMKQEEIKVNNKYIPCLNKFDSELFEILEDGE